VQKRKMSVPSGNHNLIVEPVDSRFNDWTVSDLFMKVIRRLSGSREDRISGQRSVCSPCQARKFTLKILVKSLYEYIRTGK
jgi:hypothetical protein